MILVDVYVPVLNDAFDFQLDENAETKLVIRELTAIIEKKLKCEDMCDPSGFDLYDVKTKELISPGSTLSAAGIEDGCRLMLI